MAAVIPQGERPETKFLYLASNSVCHIHDTPVWANINIACDVMYLKCVHWMRPWVQSQSFEGLPGHGSIVVPVSQKAEIRCLASLDNSKKLSLNKCSCPTQNAQYVWGVIVTLDEQEPLEIPRTFVPSSTRWTPLGPKTRILVWSFHYFKSKYFMVGERTGEMAQ